MRRAFSGFCLPVFDIHGLNVHVGCWPDLQLKPGKRFEHGAELAKAEVAWIKIRLFFNNEISKTANYNCGRWALCKYKSNRNVY